VVDNNSSDETKATVDSFISKKPERVRYVFEPRQGNAYARNTGIDCARAPIIAFLDDDAYVDRNWLRTIKSTFAEFPDLSFIGGKVLPRWEGDPPEWLTPDHWSPIAAVDYGPAQRLIDNTNEICLLTANIAFRREVFETAGTFCPALQRVKGGIGSLEDHEFLSRVCRSGKKGMYVPDMIAITYVPQHRMSKRYHRRWHTGHGRFYAIMRDTKWEESKFKLLGVPSHLYRQSGIDFWGWLRQTLIGKFNRAFEHEARLRFFAGFFLERQRRHFAKKYAPFPLV
jgi:glycosyltransferase involved in cell wall biosynthesis